MACKTALSEFDIGANIIKFAEFKPSKIKNKTFQIGKRMKKTIYFIEGDGVGKEIWQATRPVLDAAVAASKSGSLNWQELLAGKKAYVECGKYLPQATFDALSKAELAMKGPLETPVGGGIRSLNVTLRQTLDLYACIRPIR